ncbi:DUF6266 family protein [Odoribacter lunatus]|uniref:DUF6266 family protein n=1 Tax=Odoribacter lunatus TaxID=2941335 RepID=UPI00203E9E2C|nr:DUF6266 family protein [Odoribacter lunatus]
MAIFKMPFMSKLRKSMADNTYCYSRGQNILKMKVDSNSSNTQLQQLQRVKMKKLMALAKVFNSAIKIGFPTRPVTFTPWNAFVKANKEIVTVDEDLAVLIDLEKIRVAQGSREIVENLSVMVDESEQSLSFTHEAGDFAYGAEPTDVLYVVVLEKERMRTKLFRLGTRDDDSSTTVTLPQKWDMKQLEGYVFVLSADGRAASDSVHVPITVD